MYLQRWIVGRAAPRAITLSNIGFWDMHATFLNQRIFDLHGGGDSDGNPEVNLM